MDKSFIDDITDKLEVLWVMTNPELGKELLDIKNKATINVEDQKDKETEKLPEGAINLDFSDGGFHETWKQIMQAVPNAYHSAGSDPDQKRKFVLPTFSRSELDQLSGIVITP